MKKKILASFAAAAALSLGVFSGCMFGSSVSVTSIQKTDSVGLVDYYTITYSNGTTSQFTVTNGRDGENGKDGTDAQDVTAQDVYETYKKVYSDDKMTFMEFCEKYLSVNNNSTAALNSVLRSCMKVYTAFHESRFSDKLSMYCGSAVIYKMETDYTYIVTNYHVVYDSKAVDSKVSNEISAYLYGSESGPVLNDTETGLVYDDYAIKCKYIGGAINYDVAVIRANTADVLKVNPQAVPVTVSYDYSVGENTYAVGNPDDGGISVTEGIVSVDSDYVTLSIDGNERSYRSIRTDTALTHGNSGGGLFNMQGELIGLNNAGDSDITSMNYAIPASIMTGIADGVIYYNTRNGIKYTSRTLLGVTSQAENSRFVYDGATGGGYIRENVVIKTVNDKGPDKVTNSLANDLGLKVGDIITAVTVNGKKYEIIRQYQIADLLLNVRASDTIKIDYTRDGQAKETQETAVRPSDIDRID
ncbi:MAG: S1C family serine protease [Clostridia bacterium]|nr:S1C family serine protease [Clostridia bacterium]